MSLAVASSRDEKRADFAIHCLLPACVPIRHPAPARTRLALIIVESSCCGEPGQVPLSGIDEWQPPEPQGLSVTNDLIASMVLAIWLYLLPDAERSGSAGSAMTAVSAGRGARPWPAVTAVIPARDEAECVGETVASLLRQDYPGEFTVIVVDDQSRDGTAQVARAGGGGARRRRPPDRLVRPGAAGRMDRQAMGAAAGRRGSRGRAASAGLSPVHRRRHRLRARRADEARRAGAIGRLCPHLADGEAALRELRRAHVHPGLHLLLPDALPVRLGQRSSAAPPPRRPAAACWCAATCCARPAAWLRSAAP